MLQSDVLSDRDRDFLSAIRDGETPISYARRNNFSPHWAKWESRKLRQRFGVSTLREAISLSEISAEDFAALRKEQADLKAALDKLAAAKPEEKEEAREDVKDARSDLSAELKSRGLTMKDLDKLSEEKDFERFKKNQERLEAERAAAAKEEGENDEEEEVEEPKRDGLGGLRNVLGGSR